MTHPHAEIEDQDDEAVRLEEANALALRLRPILEGYNGAVVVSTLTELVAHGIVGCPSDRQEQFLNEVQFILKKRVRELRRALGQVADGRH